MRRLCAGISLVALLAGAAAAQVGHGAGNSQHDHSTTQKGGTTLRPVTLNVSGTTALSTTTVSAARLKISSGSLIVDGGASAIGISRSSVAVILDATSLPSQSTFVIAVASVTLSANGVDDVYACFNGSVRCLSANASMGATILMDGQFAPGGWANNRSMIENTVAASSAQNLSFCHTFQAPSAGSHRFGLVFAWNTAGGATCTLDANFFTGRNEFSARTW